MNAPTKLGIFAVVLASAFGGGLAAGAAIGPIDDPAPEPHAVHQEEPAPGPAPTPTPSTETHDGHTGTEEQP